MTLREDLSPLVNEPLERLDAEYKSWLNLRESHDRAVLVRAAIAMVNHGGGYIVIGMPEGEDKVPASEPRPTEFDEITQDAVNNAVTRYAEPPFQCDVRSIPHIETGVSHPVVVVPGTLAVPVISKSGQHPLRQNACYIRKPGPKTEEPSTEAEWRALFNRCIRANRDEMLDAIRAIIAGEFTSSDPEPDALDVLLNFCGRARERWEELAASPSADPESSFPHGYYEVGISIVSARPAENANELRNRLGIAGSINHSGWPPFINLDTSTVRPYVQGDCVEAWAGAPIERRIFHEPTYREFWRASLDGKLYSVRGYLEDGLTDRGSPGTFIATKVPIRQIGEILLFASRFAEAIEDADRLLIFCRYTGLSGRHLVRLDGLPMPYQAVCRSDKMENKLDITVQQVRDNLEEVITTLLAPLYIQFDFSELPLNFVRSTIDDLRNHRW